VNAMSAACVPQPGFVQSRGKRTSVRRSTILKESWKRVPMMLAEVFGPDLLIVVIVGMAIPLWAIIDAVSRPAAAFYGAGTNKTAWVIVLLVATFVLGLGLFLGLFYLMSVRRKVRNQMQLMSRP
jgi:hypothetical protein